MAAAIEDPDISSQDSSTYVTLEEDNDEDMEQVFPEIHTPGPSLDQVDHAEEAMSGPVLDVEIQVLNDSDDEDEVEEAIADEDDPSRPTSARSNSSSTLSSESIASSGPASSDCSCSYSSKGSADDLTCQRYPRGFRHSPPDEPSRFKRTSGLLASMRRSGRRILSPVIAVSSGRSADSANAYRDVLSITIHCQMWHLTNHILSYLDAVSLETCEEVCMLWKTYISKEKIWKRVVEKTALLAPDLIKQNGWSKHVTALGGQDPLYDDVYRELYWKMTNLGLLWRHRDHLERKNHVRRSGCINWCFLKSGRSVSVYPFGRGYVLKIHDDMTTRFRHSQTITLGTVKKDNLCIDANEKQIVVGGLVSQKVWVFTIKEGRQPNKSPFDLFMDALKRQNWRSNDRTCTRIYTDIFKFINAGAGVSKVKLHPDGKRMAVLLPLNQTAEIWNIAEVTRLQSHAVPSDSAYMIWRNELLVTAPTFSGIIQAVDTSQEREVSNLAGSIRRIDALAVYGKLCATGEGKYIKLWNLNCNSLMRSWNATKTFISALSMNDALIISGSSAGIVKLWELKAVLRKNATTLQPLRRISMKGMMHYPIKMICQMSYVDLVIVAKYEAKRKKDKIKFVKVKTEVSFPLDCDN